jgi:hypothetical protein
MSRVALCLRRRNWPPRYALDEVVRTEQASVGAHGEQLDRKFVSMRATGVGWITHGFTSRQSRVKLTEERGRPERLGKKSNLRKAACLIRPVQFAGGYILKIAVGVIAASIGAAQLLWSVPV